MEMQIFPLALHKSDNLIPTFQSKMWKENKEQSDPINVSVH